MSAPERIQLRRVKGWRKPDDAVVVARPTKWGNPFPMSGDWIMWTAVAIGFKANAHGRRQAAVALHRAWLLGQRLGVNAFASAPERAVGGYLEFGDGNYPFTGEAVAEQGGVT